MQMRQQWQLTAGVLPMLLLSGCGDGDQKVKAASPPPAVTVVAVVEHDIKPFVTFSGRVQARDKVDLRARIEGFLEKRLSNEGQDVKKGDLLFVIEQAPYKASIAEIKATIQKAQAALTLAELEASTPCNGKSSPDQRLTVACQELPSATSATSWRPRRRAPQP
jgi:membrane fusion protein (multidrug efflux system)